MGVGDYDQHAAEWKLCLDDPERKTVAASWLRDDTVDAWRHRRMRETLIPLIAGDPSSTWLTVGDGRFGTDAHFLIQQGLSCHASDMTSPLLEIAQQTGFIGSFSLENAEGLGFRDNEFDYVYCKESYHHFPRPWLAVYEMFRVARKAVILLEPADNSCVRSPSISRLLKDVVKVLVGRSMTNAGGYHGFEPVGNYAYTLSLRECEKFLLGMHYRWIAWCGVNDYYEKGVEFCPIQGGSVVERKLRSKVESAIAKKDEQCRKGADTYSLISVILFKEPPHEQLLAGIAQAGWSVKQLPKNPYR